MNSEPPLPLPLPLQAEQQEGRASSSLRLQQVAVVLSVQLAALHSRMKVLREDVAQQLARAAHECSSALQQGSDRWAVACRANACMRC